MIRFTFFSSRREHYCISLRVSCRIYRRIYKNLVPIVEATVRFFIYGLCTQARKSRHVYNVMSYTRRKSALGKISSPGNREDQHSLNCVYYTYTVLMKSK